MMEIDKILGKTIKKIDNLYESSLNGRFTMVSYHGYDDIK